MPQLLLRWRIDHPHTPRITVLVAMIIGVARPPDASDRMNVHVQSQPAVLNERCCIFGRLRA
jgi:hypothetical protein